MHLTCNSSGCNYYILCVCDVGFFVQIFQYLKCMLSQYDEFIVSCNFTLLIDCFCCCSFARFIRYTLFFIYFYESLHRSEQILFTSFFSFHFSSFYGMIILCAMDYVITMRFYNFISSVCCLLCALLYKYILCMQQITSSMEKLRKNITVEGKRTRVRKTELVDRFQSLSAFADIAH